jgi:hypothetical protein
MSSINRQPSISRSLTRRGHARGNAAARVDIAHRVAGPAHQRLIASNLACETFGEIALCTFELDGADSLGRRTILLRKQKGAWKIIHIHASNVYPKAEQA